MAGCGSGRWCATAPWPPTRGCAPATRCCPRRCSPAPPASCATWPPWAATYCSVPAARTSTTRPRPATSASRAAAATLQVSDGTVTEARLALGGVAPKPWRAREAEGLLVGGPADEAAFGRAAEAELASAAVRKGNAFKVALARSTIVATLRELSKEGALR